MKSRLYLLILLILSLVYSCYDYAEVHQSKKKWHTYIKEYQNINEFLKKENYVTDVINYYTDDSVGVLKISIITNNNKIMVLKFPEFDIVGDFKGYAKIYFTQEGKPFIKIKPIKNNLLETTIFNIDNASFYKNNIKINDNLIVNKSNVYKDYDYQCEIIKLVDNLLHRFRKVPKYAPTRCLNNRADFLAIIDSIPMYKNKGDQKPFKYILKGDSIKYLIADSSSNEYKTCDFFLKVKNMNSLDSGWVCLLDIYFINMLEID